MNAVLAFLGRHAMSAMVVGVFVGLLVPSLAAVMRPLLTPSVWLLLVISLLRVDPGEGRAHLAQPGRLAALLAVFLVGQPDAKHLLVAPLPLTPGVAGAMVLTAGSSVLISTPTLGLLMGLDGAAILVVMLGTTLLVPLTLPPVALVLLGLDLGLGAGALMARLAALVGS
ncbi:MAG: hypothetical protein VW405_02225, partial [Rhodospirillaceae bacterium]